MQIAIRATLLGSLLFFSAPLFAADIDRDGIADTVDNCMHAANAAQTDSDADGFGNRCDPDLNNDGTVGPLDLQLLKALFHTRERDADLDGDGYVNFTDLAIMKSLFGRAPGSTGWAGTGRKRVAVNATVSAMAQIPSVDLPGQLVVEIWMDFAADPTIGGGINILYDGSLFGFESFVFDPALGDDPELRRIPDTDTPNILNGLAFGEFDGLSGPSRVGLLTLRARLPGATALDLALNVLPAGPFVSASTFTAQPVDFESTSGEVNFTAGSRTHLYEGSVSVCTPLCGAAASLAVGTELRGHLFVDVGPDELFFAEDIGFAIEIFDPSTAQTGSSSDKSANPVWLDAGTASIVSAFGSTDANGMLASGDLLLDVPGLFSTLRFDFELNTFTLSRSPDSRLVAEGNGVFSNQGQVPFIDVEPSTLSFGTVVVGEINTLAVTVGNDSLRPLEIGQTGAADSLEAPFQFDDDTCSLQTIDAGGTCQITVRFSSTELGTFADSFDIPSNDLANPSVIVSVNGSTRPANPGIAVTPFPLHFAVQPPGSAADRNVTITNAGGMAPLLIGTIGGADPLSTPFTVVEDNCSSQSLEQGQDCLLIIRFESTTTGAFTDSLDIPSNDPQRPLLTLLISGNAGDSAILVSPLELHFEDTFEFYDSSGNVTIANDGEVPLFIGVNDTLSPPFYLTSTGDCENGVDPRQSCILTIGFAPLQDEIGSFADSFDIVSNDPNQLAVTVTVQGKALTRVAGAIFGADATLAWCRNLSTGQAVLGPYAAVQSAAFCARGGLSYASGQYVSTVLKGVATVGDSVQGKLDGVNGTFAICNNQTTGQTVSFELQGATTADCTAQGLQVTIGDALRIVLRGTVQ